MTRQRFEFHLDESGKLLFRRQDGVWRRLDGDNVDGWTAGSLEELLFDLAETARRRWQEILR